MNHEEIRLLLRGRDLMVAARGTIPDRTNLEMLVRVASDVVKDADTVLARHRVLPPTVEPIIGLVRAIVQLAQEAGRLPTQNTPES